MKGIVLKASAGTGKTYRLSLEYIAALLRGESYKDILVMTFTKKATSEIQERILEFLEKMSLKEDLEIENNIKALYPDLEFTDATIKKIYEEILSNRDRMNIFTIDGFINRIFKTVIAPHLNVFSYEMIDDTDNIKILLKCFEKIVQEKEHFEAFKLFLENRTEKNIENYLNFIRKIIDSRWNMTLIKQTDKIKLNKDKYENELNISKYINELLSILEEIRVKKNDESSLEKYLKANGKWMLSVEENKQKNYILKNWNLIIKEEHCWSKVKVKTTSKIDLDAEIEELESVYSEFKNELSKDIFNQDILNLEKEILLFMDNLYKIYDEIKFTEKKFTHSDVSNYLFQYLEKEEVNLIRDGRITSYFKDIFDSEFKIIFIDEFQDTSILQWRILRGLINESENLICVGDEKQSIYGWRGGEKALFENLSDIVQIEEESMSTSYRSCRNVVDFTNQIFSNISSNYKEKNSPYSWEFTDVIGKSEKPGYYEIIKGEKDEKGKYIEKDMIEEIITSLKSNFSKDYGSIAIIARSNSQLREIAERLSEEKIPFLVESNDSIISHRAVAPIFNFIKFFVNRDIMSLLEFMRSDVVKINNETLKSMLQNKEEIEEFLFTDKSEIKNSSEELQKILKKIKSIIQKECRDKNIILSVVETFNISQIYSTKSDFKNIFKFLEISKEFDNIFDFYQILAEELKSPKYKQVSVEDEKSITLLTIHKSKGLEFETVYYYHAQPGNTPNSGIQFHIDFKSPFNEIDNFVFIDKKYECVLKELEEYRYLKEFEIKIAQEELNNIYVALTRAKKNIFLVLGMKVNDYLGDAVESLQTLKKGEITISEKKDKNQESQENQENQKNEKNEEDEERVAIQEIDLFEKEIEKLEEPKKRKAIDISTEEKRLLGNAIHYYFEFIIHNTEKEHEIARLRTLSKYSSIVGEIKLKKIISSEEFKNVFLENKDIFSSDWDYIYPEYEIYYDNALKRIDRIMIELPKKNLKGKILIVDYKTGEIDEEQLGEYIEIIHKHLSDLGKIDSYEIIGKFLELKL